MPVDRIAKAEGHASDDEHGVYRTRHAGGDKAVDDIACSVDDRESGDEENGTGNKRVPHGRQSENERNEPCDDGGGKRGNHGAGVGIEFISDAETVGDEPDQGCSGCDRRLRQTAAEQ